MFEVKPGAVAGLASLLACRPEAVSKLTVEFVPDLDPLELLDLDLWPAAVNPGLIVADERDRRLRARSILSTIVNGRQAVGLKLLDFGCGDGHLVQAANSRGLLATGVDLNSPSGTATSSAPYDLIVLYDVLDHLVGDPVSVLKEIRSWLSSGGEIHVRCHPWTSRHGTHAYLDGVNKAFAHLFADVGEPILRLWRPSTTYQDWFTAAGLTVKSKVIVEDEVEPIFLQEPWLTRLLDAFRPMALEIASSAALVNALKASFYDYVLVR